MNKDFLARFGVTEFHYEDATGAYSYDPSKEYNTDGEKFILGEKKNSMYLDNAKWLLIVDKKKNEKILYTLINSESELEKILGKFSEDVKEESSDNSEATKKAEARHAIICSRLKGLRGKRVSSLEDLKNFVKTYRNIIEGRAGAYMSGADELEAFIKKGCIIHFEEYDDRVDFYLSSTNGEKLIVMEGYL